MKCFILSGYLLSVKVNYLQTKEYNIFLKITTCQQPDIYNGLIQVYCIKSERRSITIKRVKLRLVPWQVSNVHYKQTKYLSPGGLSEMVFWW